MSKSRAAERDFTPILDESLADFDTEQLLRRGSYSISGAAGPSRFRHGATPSPRLLLNQRCSESYSISGATGPRPAEADFDTEQLLRRGSYSISGATGPTQSAVHKVLLNQRCYGSYSVNDVKG